MSFEIEYEEVSEVTYALFGDYGVGKTAFLVRHQTGEFIRHFHSTDNISLRLFDLNTNEGKITIAVTENHINEDCQGIMIMFDITNRDSFRYAVQITEKLGRMCPYTPIILIGNKVDIVMRTVMTRDVHERIAAKELKIVKYIEISAANMYNLSTPFLELLKEKYENISLEIDVDINSSIETSMGSLNVSDSSVRDSDDMGDKENILMMSDHEY